MFNNPLRKYAVGGTAPTQEQQKLLADFIEWLPKRVKEFQGMKPEAIVQALDGMSKTPEGQKQVQQLMEQFQQEMQQSGQQAFRNGGKIHDFICKHAKGGAIDCGCGGSVKKAQNGSGKAFNNIDRYYNENGESLNDADLETIARRKQPRTITYTSIRNPWNMNWNNFNGYWTKRDMLPVYQGNVTAFNYDVNPENGYYDVAPGIPKPSLKTDNYGNAVYQEGGNITRSAAFNMAGTNDEGSVGRRLLRQTYRGLKNQFRNEGLRGREMRQAARIALMGPSTPDLDEIVVEDIALPEIPQVTLAPDKPMNITINPYVENLDKYSFNDAFRRASQRGDKVFNWRGKDFAVKFKEDAPQQVASESESVAETTSTPLWSDQYNIPLNYQGPTPNLDRHNGVTLSQMIAERSRQVGRALTKQEINTIKKYYYNDAGQPNGGYGENFDRKAATFVGPEFDRSKVRQEPSNYKPVYNGNPSYGGQDIPLSYNIPISIIPYQQVTLKKGGKVEKHQQEITKFKNILHK